MPERFLYRGSSFAYTDQGRGPAVVFLHGHLENRAMWQGLMEALPRAYRNIALDLPGHGTSENLGYTHSMTLMAEVVRALLHHLKLRRVWLCGHSMGGYVALAFAEKYPHMLRGLALINSTPRTDSPQRKKERGQAIALAQRDHERFAALAVPRLFAPQSRERLHQKISYAVEQARQTTPQGNIAALRGMSERPDRTEVLRQATYPVAVLAGEQDPILPPQQWQVLEKLPGVQVFISPYGHMTHWEDPRVLENALRYLLKS